MVTKEERRLHAFLFERYCAALACPNAKTQDALANALRVAHRRVRSTLQSCFADETIAVARRRELLETYGRLDRGVEEFWTGLTMGDPNWVKQGQQLIGLVEHAHAMALACRREGHKAISKPPQGPVPFEEAKTTVFDRGVPPRVEVGHTQPMLG